MRRLGSIIATSSLAHRPQTNLDLQNPSNCLVELVRKLIFDPNMGLLQSVQLKNRLGFSP